MASYRIVGTKGHLHADPAYEYAEGLEYTLTIDGKTTRKKVGKRDQFAAELLYFSDCILNDREPEPSGEEGHAGRADRPGALRVGQDRQGPSRSVHSRNAQRPTGRQRITRPGVRKPSLVKVQSASI